MTIYITNASSNLLFRSGEKNIVIHFNITCKSLHASYDRKEVHLDNSGVKELKFDSFIEWEKYFKEYDCKTSICSLCEQDYPPEFLNEPIVDEAWEAKVLEEFIREMDAINNKKEA